MEEKIITGHKNGMLVLLLELVLYIAAVVFLIVGINAGFLPLVVLCVILLLLGWIPLCGLRVLKPQEALVLTLFGKYIGTLKGEGFYWVNPFCSSFNPPPRRSSTSPAMWTAATRARTFSLPCRARPPRSRWAAARRSRSRS